MENKTTKVKNKTEPVLARVGFACLVFSFFGDLCLCFVKIGCIFLVSFPLLLFRLASFGCVGFRVASFGSAASSCLASARSVSVFPKGRHQAGRLRVPERLASRLDYLRVQQYEV